MSGFVYVWYDRKHRRYYVGSHWGGEDDGYVCSSSWMKQAYSRRKDDFKRRIVARVSSTHAELLEEENRWLSMIRSDELGKRFYNLKNRCGKIWWSTHKKEEIVEKIADTQRGKKRKPYDEKRRKEASERMRRQWADGTRKRENPKMGLAKIGVPRSEETKKKLSDALRGRCVGHKWTRKDNT